ncbi:MAG: LysM peptidoglycan-binding domain-containing protein [bacterium]|nr:LysM peptidoglycan-binding domain-containing protein [bacterium]
MHKSAIAGLSLLTLSIIAAKTPNAAALDILEIQNAQAVAVVESVNVTEQLTITEGPVVQEKSVAPLANQFEKHVVVKGDSLSKIAKKFNTSWRRIYDKNLNVKNPDVITVGMELTIPNDAEKLKSRPLPVIAPISAPVVHIQAVSKPAKAAASTPVRKVATNAPVRKVATKKPASTFQTSTRGSSSGNLYTPGNCTWYVKSRRPDMPNNLGNADTWVIRARAQGMSTGSTPRAGAVGQRGMHVVYVKSVNRDGTVNIIEMNHKGLYVITERTLPGNYFQYIY